MTDTIASASAAFRAASEGQHGPEALHLAAVAANYVPDLIKEIDGLLLAREHLELVLLRARDYAFPECGSSPPCTSCKGIRDMLREAIRACEGRCPQH